MWKEPGSTIYHTKLWTTTYQGSVLSVADIIYTGTDKSIMKDPALKTGHREGSNELGQFWKEEWQHNIVTGFKKWNKLTIEEKDNYEKKFGEFGEDIPGEARHREDWKELTKKDEDYWEFKSEKSILYPSSSKLKKQISQIKHFDWMHDGSTKNGNITFNEDGSMTAFNE